MKKNTLLSALSAIVLTAGAGAVTLAEARPPADLVAFQRAISSGNAADLRRFLQTYPTSPHARQAFSRLNNLSRRFVVARVAAIVREVRESRGGGVPFVTDSIY
jgi:hypothetical protein